MLRYFLFFMLSILGLPTVAQVNYAPNTIKVIGKAVQEIEPDIIHLIVNLQEVNERNKKIPMLLARNEFMKICKEVGVPQADIDKSYLRNKLIYEKMSFWRAARTGLNKKEVYDIKFTDFDKLLAIIEKLDQPYVKTIQFGEQTHSQIEKFKREVKEDAAKFALQKAKYLAKASSLEFKKVIYMEELSDNKMVSGQQRNQQVLYSKKGGRPKVNFGFEPMQLTYEVQLICEVQ